MSSTTTTVNDSFDSPPEGQTPTSIPPALPNTGGWTPVNSTRQLFADLSSTTDINITEEGSWSFTLSETEFATLQYKVAPPDTSYNLSGILAIIVQQVPEGLVL